LGGELNRKTRTLEHRKDAAPEIQNPSETLPPAGK
jgi:hypothetical protein